MNPGREHRAEKSVGYDRHCLAPHRPFCDPMWCQRWPSPCLWLGIPRRHFRPVADLPTPPAIVAQTRIPRDPLDWLPR